MNNLLSSRQFKAAVPFLGISILIATIFYGRIFINKFQDELKKYRNEVQQINIERPSNSEEPKLQNIQLNNVAYNPQIVSTFSLMLTLMISLTFISICYIGLYHEYFSVAKMLKLGYHRMLISFAIPSFFYCRNSSLRRFVYESYFP